jgi:hypothetical protein
MTTIHSRIGAVLLVIAGGLVLGGAGGCQVGQEGERCNPYLSHDECGAGLACKNPPNCPEYYCCPTSTSGTRISPYCQNGCNQGNCSIIASGGDADPGDCGVDGGGSMPSGDDGGGDGPSE